MKPAVVYGVAAGLGSISVVGVGYAVKTVLGLGENSSSFAFAQNAVDSPRSVPEPETVLLLGIALLGLVLWRHKSTAARLLRR
jgi:hypothetical protein